MLFWLQWFAQLRAPVLGASADDGQAGPDSEMLPRFRSALQICDPVAEAVRAGHRRRQRERLPPGRLLPLRHFQSDRVANHREHHRHSGGSARAHLSCGGAVELSRVQSGGGQAAVVAYRQLTE